MSEKEFVEPPLYCLRDKDGTLFSVDGVLPWYDHYAQAGLLVKEWLGGSWEVYPALDEELPPVPWDKDIISELTTKDPPYSNDNLTKLRGWWQRDLSKVDGMTIHHTLSDSPHGTARYCALTKKLPSIQYHIWVTQTGEVLLCAPLEWGIYHDSTGLRNTHLSIGMAGRLHEYKPADVQIEAAVKVCTWAVATLPGVTSVDRVQGHRDWVQIYHDRGYYKDRDIPTPWTICPGWAADTSGRWKAEFYEGLERALSG